MKFEKKNTETEVRNGTSTESSILEHLRNCTLLQYTQSSKITHDIPLHITRIQFQVIM